MLSKETRDEEKRLEKKAFTVVGRLHESAYHSGRSRLSLAISDPDYQPQLSEKDGEGAITERKFQFSHELAFLLLLFFFFFLYFRFAGLPCGNVTFLEFLHEAEDRGFCCFEGVYFCSRLVLCHFRWMKALSESYGARPPAFRRVLFCSVTFQKHFHFFSLYFALSVVAISPSFLPSLSMRLSFAVFVYVSIRLLLPHANRNPTWCPVLFSSPAHYVCSSKG